MSQGNANLLPMWVPLAAHQLVLLLVLIIVIVIVIEPEGGRSQTSEVARAFACDAIPISYAS